MYLCSLETHLSSKIDICSITLNVEERVHVTLGDPRTCRGTGLGSLDLWRNVHDRAWYTVECRSRAIECNRCNNQTEGNQGKGYSLRHHLLPKTGWWIKRPPSWNEMRVVLCIVWLSHFLVRKLGETKWETKSQISPFTSQIRTVKFERWRRFDWRVQKRQCKSSKIRFDRSAFGYYDRTRTAKATKPTNRKPFCNEVATMMDIATPFLWRFNVL